MKKIKIYTDNFSLAPLFDNSMSLYNTYDDSKLHDGVYFDDAMRVNNYIGFKICN